MLEHDLRLAVSGSLSQKLPTRQWAVAEHGVVAEVGIALDASAASSAAARIAAARQAVPTCPAKKMKLNQAPDSFT